MSPPPTHSHFGSPLFLSPPISPPPLTTIAPAGQQQSRVDSAASESATPIVLSPVPKSPTRPGMNVPRSTSPMTPLMGQCGPMSTTSTYLSVSGQRIPTKSKTDDLERYIAEIEASEAEPGTLGSGGSAPTAGRKYTRRRYTDNRHPTTELPDMTSASTGAINLASTSSTASTGQQQQQPALVRRRTQQLA